MTYLVGKTDLERELEDSLSQLGDFIKAAEEFTSCFTEEDCEFNREMAARGKKLASNATLSKKTKSHDCNFTSDILSEFRRKWRIK